jgi:hypothetical protein
MVPVFALTGNAAKPILNFPHPSMLNSLHPVYPGKSQRKMDTLFQMWDRKQTKHNWNLSICSDIPFSGLQAALSDLNQIIVPISLKL